MDLQHYDHIPNNPRNKFNQQSTMSKLFKSGCPMKVGSYCCEEYIDVRDSLSVYKTIVFSINPHNSFCSAAAGAGRWRLSPMQPKGFCCLETFFCPRGEL